MTDILMYVAIALMLGILVKLFTKKNEPSVVQQSALALQLSDRWLDTVDTIVGKVLSGRFIAVTLDTIVFPGCVILCGYLTHTGKVEAETFIAVLGGYALLVKETRLKYFDRTDRKEQDEKINTSVTTVSTTDSSKPAG